MKILFLNPPNIEGLIYMKEIGRCGRKSVAGEIWPQTGLACLAAVALREQTEAAIIDGIAEGLSPDKLLKQISSFNPDIIISHTTTPTFSNDAEVMKQIREVSGAFQIFTGTHCSVLPEESLMQSEVDAVLVGEGEQTLRELIQSGADFKNPEHLQTISGIAFRNGETIVLTESRELLDDLDTLPFPARQLLPNERYTMPFFGKESFATVIPSRGCPFQCTFCRAGSVWGSRIRIRSPKNILEELRNLKEQFGITNIVFMTDSFTLKKEWTLQFLNLLNESNLNIRYICNSRVDAINEEMLRLMKDTGCILLSYGLESGNQEILDRAKKGIKLNNSERAIQLTKQAGLLSMAYFIIGLPGETLETIDESIRFARRLNPDFVNFHIATPFPGTELYAYAKAHNLLVTDDWSAFEEEGSAVIRTEDLSPKELEAAQRRAMRSFYIRPGYILKRLFSIRSFGDLKSHVKAGMNIIRSLFNG